MKAPSTTVSKQKKMQCLLNTRNDQFDQASEDRPSRKPLNPGAASRITPMTCLKFMNLGSLNSPTFVLWDWETDKTNPRAM
jgi:hypothetical protein